MVILTYTRVSGLWKATEEDEVYADVEGDDRNLKKLNED